MNGLKLIDTDEQFFSQHPTRKTLIRPARDGEFRGEFASLGQHDATRRVVLCWRSDPQPGFSRGMIMKTPMVLFGDETVENEDSVLLPILHQLMADAAKQHGMRQPEGQTRH